MECVAVGDLHLTDAAGTGGLAKYVPDSDSMVIAEVEKVIGYARDHGIDTLIQEGDVCDGPRLSYPAMIALSSMFARNDDISFHIMLGNHDQYGESPATGHSLEVLKLLYSRPNVKFYTKPKTVTIDGAKVRFLPYPHEDFDLKALNVFHKEVHGSKGDSGRLMTDDKLSKSKAVVVAGHLHTAHKVRNTHYTGTLYQTNFGERLPKYFHHINFNSVNDYTLDLIAHEPTYKLHTVVLNSRSDLALIPKGQFNLVKLVIQDGADVSASDYADYSNIAVLKNFKSKEDLHAVLTEDLIEGEQLVVNIDDFFKSWIASLDVTKEERAHVRAVRRRVLNRAGA